MANRFHNKFHNNAHHTDPTVGDIDSAEDPMASPAYPFVGDFYLNGGLAILNGNTISGNHISASSIFTTSLSGITVTSTNLLTTNLLTTNLSANGEFPFANHASRA